MRRYSGTFGAFTLRITHTTATASNSHGNTLIISANTPPKNITRVATISAAIIPISDTPVASSIRKKATTNSSSNILVLLKNVMPCYYKFRARIKSLN
ncbi:hypothetical protein ESA_00097 [Cronobacter sakazakii ATCC BAA-894]|uniref:Uncharacterized protein n=1 Tax=Cronobacter sakazakii (strain ATCC BAA-894) TaxID=290339 RepID=A7MPN3_CROS8|nr:hypothetical protein ESA_00097 [Cronobacter sakazakii ATCC BAA-894]